MKYLWDYIKEAIDQVAAGIITVLIIATMAWPFMSDGFWTERLKYVWLAALLSVLWVFSGIIIEIIKAAYKDWKQQRRKRQ